MRMRGIIQMARQKVQKIVIGFLCLCTVLMFSMNFTCPEIDNTYGWLYSVLENLRLSINKDMFQLTIYWGALFYCNLKLLNLKYEKCYGIYVLNLILALFWLFSESLQIDNTFNHITGQSGQVAKSLIYVLGAADATISRQCTIERITESVGIHFVRL